MAPINDAARDGDVDNLRRELERGVPPDTPDDNGYFPLFTAVIHERTDCVSMLLRAGADPNATSGGRRTFKPLHQAAFDYSHEIVRMLLEAGACVDNKTSIDWRAIDYAFRHSFHRLSPHLTTVYALLLRAGSELPKDSPSRPLREEPYLGRILSAGGFKNYERAHLAALAKTLSPKLALPPELVRTVVEFYLHAGFYPFTPAA